MQLRLSSALSGCSVQHLCSLTFLCPRKEPTSRSFFCRGLCSSGFSPRLLFPLCILMRKSHHTHGFSFHPHADDSQIYICDKCNVIYIYFSFLTSLSRKSACKPLPHGYPESTIGQPKSEAMIWFSPASVFPILPSNPSGSVYFSSSSSQSPP